MLFVKKGDSGNSVLGGRGKKVFTRTHVVTFEPRARRDVGITSRASVVWLLRDHVDFLTALKDDWGPAAVQDPTLFVCNFFAGCGLSLSFKHQTSRRGVSLFRVMTKRERERER